LIYALANRTDGLPGRGINYQKGANGNRNALISSGINYKSIRMEIYDSTSPDIFSGSWSQFGQLLKLHQLIMNALRKFPLMMGITGAPTIGKVSQYCHQGYGPPRGRG